MLNVIQNAEAKAMNTVPLADLLAAGDARFRQVLCGALAREGFELDGPLPCLQHPLEILEAIHWVESLDPGVGWQAFRKALLAASRTGILLDVSSHASRPGTWHPCRSEGLLSPVPA